MFKKILNKTFLYFPFILFILVLLFSTRNFLFTEGNILYAEFLGSKNYIFFLEDFFNAFSNYTAFGSPNIGFTTVYGINPVFWIVPPPHQIGLLTIISAFEKLFGSFSMKLYILLALSMPFIGMYFFSKNWFSDQIKNKNTLKYISYITAIIYSLSTVMSSRITAGHLKYNLAHGLFPILLISTINFIENKNKNAKNIFLSSSLVFAIIIWLMPHLITFYLLFLLLYFFIFTLFDLNKLKRLILISLGSIALAFIINIHLWLPPLLFSDILSYIKDPQYYLPFVYLTSRVDNIFKLFTLQSSIEANYIPKALYQNILELKLLLPLFAFVGFVLSKNKRKAFFIILLTSMGIILSYAINPPFENFYIFLFEKTLIFNPFRELGKFLLFYIFGVSILCGYFFIYLFNLIKNKKYLIPIITIFFTLFLLYLNPSFTTGDFNGIIKRFDLPKKYENLNVFLKNQPEEYRVAIFPNDKSIGNYDWYPKNLLSPPYANIFLNLFPLSKDLANSSRTMSDLSSRYLDYIESNLDSEWAIRSLGDANVKYLIVDHSVPDYKVYVNKLNNNPLLKSVDVVQGFSIYKIENYKTSKLSKITPVYYFGDIKGKSLIPKQLALINLGIDDSSIGILKQNLSSNIVLYESSTNDLFLNTIENYRFSFFPEARFPKDTAKEFFIPGEYLRYVTQKGIMFYNPEILQTGGISSISKKIKLKEGNYRLFLSTISIDNQSNNIRLSLNNYSKTMKDFREKKEGLEWIDFGNVKINHPYIEIKIDNLENANFYLDSLLIVPKGEYQKLKKEFDLIISTKNITEINNSSNLDLTLKENSKSIYLYSKSYSKYWNLCNTKPFRSNFYATGFYCNNDKILEKPNYKPNAIYQFSLIASLSMYLILFATIIKSLLTKNDKTN